MAKTTKEPTSEELEAHARKNYARLFVNYDNPARALDIWFDYLPEIFQMDLLGNAREIVEKTETEKELDSKLELLLSGPKFKRLVIKDAISGRTGGTTDASNSSKEIPILSVRKTLYLNKD